MMAFREKFGGPPVLETATQDDIVHTTHREIYKLKKEVWRAALECVLGQCHHYQSQDVIDWILKELEEN